MNANDADTISITAADLRVELELIEKMPDEEREQLLTSSRYAQRIEILWEEILATEALHASIRQATFTDEEFADYEKLSGRHSELDALEKKRFRSLNARTGVVTYALHQMRTAFLCRNSQTEIRKLHAEIFDEIQQWDGDRTAHLRRAYAAIGNLAGQCELRGPSSDFVRDRLKKIIALEMEPEEKAHRGRALWPYWLDQLNLVYTADDAKRFGTDSHREAAAKLVKRERKRALQSQSPDTSS